MTKRQLSRSRGDCKGICDGFRAGSCGRSGLAAPGVCRCAGCWLSMGQTDDLRDTHG
jgi:hypothetical protein